MATLYFGGQEIEIVDAKYTDSNNVLHDCKEIYIGNELIYPLGDYITITDIAVDVIPAKGGSVSSAVVSYKVRGSNSTKKKTVTFSAVTAASLGKTERTAQTLISTRQATITEKNHSAVATINVYQAKNTRKLTSSTLLEEAYEVTTIEYSDVQLSTPVYSLMGANGSKAVLNTLMYTAKENTVTNYYSAKYEELYTWDSEETEIGYRGGSIYNTETSYSIVTSGGTLNCIKLWEESGRNISVDASTGHVTGASRGATAYTQANVAQIRVTVEFVDSYGHIESDYSDVYVQQQSNVKTSTVKEYTRTESGTDGHSYSNFTGSLTYTDVHASGAAAVPTLSFSIKYQYIDYTQRFYKEKYTWTSGSTSYSAEYSESKVYGDSHSETLYGSNSNTNGATLSWSGTVNDDAIRPVISSSNGNVTCDSRMGNAYSRGSVFTASCAIAWHGKTLTLIKDVYQQSNTYTVTEVTVKDAYSTTDYEYSNHQITAFAYRDIAANGSKVTPSFAYSIDKTKVVRSYSRTYYNKYTWTSYYVTQSANIGGTLTDTNRTSEAAVTSGATVTFSISKIYSGATLADSSTGAVSSTDLKTTATAYRQIANVTATISYAGGSATKTAGVYQAENKVTGTSTVWAANFSIRVINSVGIEFTTIPYEGGSIYMLQANGSYTTTNTWSSGSTSSSNGNGAIPNVTFTSNVAWLTIGDYSSPNQATWITVKKNEGEHNRTATITATHNGNVVKQTVTQAYEVMPVINGSRAFCRIGYNWFVQIIQVSLAGSGSSTKPVFGAYAVYYNESAQSTTEGYAAKTVKGTVKYSYLENLNSTTRVTKTATVNGTSAFFNINNKPFYGVQIATAITLSIASKSDVSLTVT